jgi:hypothetical protein
MITFALCMTMGKSQGWGHSQNALRDLLGITGIQSIVLSGLWMVLAGLLWMVGKCLHQCHVDSQLLFLSFHVWLYPSFLPSFLLYLKMLLVTFPALHYCWCTV